MSSEVKVLNPGVDKCNLSWICCLFASVLLKLRAGRVSRTTLVSYLPKYTSLQEGA